MSKHLVGIGLLSVVGLAAVALLRERRSLAAEARSETRWADHYHRENLALRAKVGRQEARWQATLDAVIEDWGDECDGLITQIGDLKEQIAAQAYVIGALKTQAKDAQQAGVTLQTVVAALYEQNEGLLAKVKAHGKPQEPPYQEYQRLTAENEKLRQLLDWALRPEAHAALMAAYANAGKATEGLDSNIPY
jgi:chromosome segregation ATPase